MGRDRWIRERHRRPIYSVVIVFRVIMIPNQSVLVDSTVSIRYSKTQTHYQTSFEVSHPSQVSASTALLRNLRSFSCKHDKLARR